MIVTQSLKDGLSALSEYHRAAGDQFWHLWYALTLFTEGQHAAFVCRHCSWEPAWISQPACPEHANMLTHEICEGSNKPFRVKKVIANPGEMSAAALESGAEEELRDV